MTTEAVTADPRPLWSRYRVLLFKYQAIFFAVTNTIISLSLAAAWAIEWTRISEQPWQHRFFVLWLAIGTPLLTPLTAVMAWRMTNKLTCGAEYRQAIMWAVWCALGSLLMVCYAMMMMANTVGELIRTPWR